MISVPAFVVAGAKPNPNAQIAKAITPNFFHMIDIPPLVSRIEHRERRTVAPRPEENYEVKIKN